uniref:Katanin catalytic subunit A1 like 2 n=1 Tax=Homo sapiens TaxID=9606 RepID=A0A8I5KR23_HUMAN
MELSYQTLKFTHQAREADDERQLSKSSQDQSAEAPVQNHSGEDRGHQIAQ